MVFSRGHRYKVIWSWFINIAFLRILWNDRPFKKSKDIFPCIIQDYKHQFEKYPFDFKIYLLSGYNISIPFEEKTFHLIIDHLSIY